MVATVEKFDKVDVANESKKNSKKNSSKNMDSPAELETVTKEI